MQCSVPQEGYEGKGGRAQSLVSQNQNGAVEERERVTESVRDCETIRAAGEARG